MNDIQSVVRRWCIKQPLLNLEEAPILTFKQKDELYNQSKYGSLFLVAFRLRARAYRRAGIKQTEDYVLRDLRMEMMR
jgi:hypothetical protein